MKDRGLGSSSARRTASRSRMASRPSTTAARSSWPKAPGPARSGDPPGAYRSTVRLTSRFTQYDTPNPNDAPVTSQKAA